jgi:hypothetical protein
MTNATRAATLTEFLLARIAADAAVARSLIAEGPWNEFHAGDRSGPTRDDEYSALHIGAGRVLAECEAKRRIVEGAAQTKAESDAAGHTGLFERVWTYETVLRHLAAVYAEHPDYRDEWRP